MANTSTLTDAVIALRGEDLSGQSNSVTLSLEQQTEASNAFGDTFEIFAPTLKTLNGSVNGFFKGDTIDAELFNIINNQVSDADLAVARDSALGSKAWMLTATVTGNESPGESHGELIKFGFDFSNGGEFVKSGTLMENGDFSALGAGTAQNLGSVGANETLYAQLHVVGAGTTLDAKIESDDASGFASPTDRITFSTFSETGSERKSAAGAISDSWFRLNVTNITGTFTIILVLAVQ